MFPRRVRSKCPAIMFAASRTASVPGRITFLTVSIITINGMRAPGVPLGTKCANMCWVWLIHPKIIKDSHSGRARARVIARCLVLVNTYGISPRRLLNIISENSDTNMMVLPWLLGPRRVLNSE